MEGSAGEKYLRLLVEAVLVDGRSRGRPVDPHRLRHAGAALVAVGAVEALFVEHLDADLGLALEIRRAHPDRTRLALVGPTDDTATTSTEVAEVPARFAARSVAVGANAFVVAEGTLTVEHISFGPDGATLVEVLRVREPETGGNRAQASPDPIRPTPARSRPWRPAPRAVSRDHGPAEHPGPPQVGPAHPGSGRPTPRAGGPGTPPQWRPSGPGREQLRIVDDHGGEYRLLSDAGTDDFEGRRWRSRLEPVPGPGTAWLAVSLGPSAPVRLDVTGPGGVARGLARTRRPGALWLDRSLHASLAEALSTDKAVLTAATRSGADALLAVGHLDSAEPLLHQLAILEAGAPLDELDPALASPLAGRHRPTGDEHRVLALARAIELGDRTARLDVAVTGARGLHLSGRFEPWRPEEAGAWMLAGFDDRHNHYVSQVIDVRGGTGGADVTWQMLPALDPAARSLRLVVSGGDAEASVEIVLDP